MIKYSKIINLLFLLVIFFLLVVSFNEYFGRFLNKYYPDFYAYKCSFKLSYEEYEECRSHNTWYKHIWIENGLVENLQLIFLFISIVILSLTLKNATFRKYKIFKIFLILKLFGISFIFFEESSWLQHFLSYQTPEILKNINYQKEFNLHNTSRIFNEIPRSIVLIWCCFSSIFFFILKKKVSSEISLILLPSNRLIGISILLILFSLPNLLADKLNLIDWYSLHLNYAGDDTGRHLIFSPLIKEGYNLNQFMIILLSSNYFRFSELQELFFYYYFFIHTIYFTNKIKIYK